MTGISSPRCAELGTWQGVARVSLGGQADWGVWGSGSGAFGGASRGRGGVGRSGRARVLPYAAFPAPLSTCACVEYNGQALKALVKNVTILCIHGKMKHKRNKIFSEFRELKR